MANLKDLNIILIEDNPDDASLTMRSLKDAKIANNIEWLKDGEEGWNFLSSPDNLQMSNKSYLILLDLKLPKIKGTELLRKIKSHLELKMIPVIIMTSSRQDRDLKTCYELGVNSYVVKPINFSEFSEVTRSVGMYWVLINEYPSN